MIWERGKCLAVTLSALSAISVVVVGLGSGSEAAVCLHDGAGCGPGPLLELRSEGVRVSPQVLPKGKPAPIAFSGGAEILTKDGSHPSALREMMLNVDKDVEFDMRGLPVCEGRRLSVRRDLEEVIRECREAVVGLGEAKGMISFPEQIPIRASSRIVVLNGSQRGRPRKLFVLGELRIPVPALIVAQVELRRKASGLQAIVKIPRIVGGAASLTAFQLNLRRIFSHRGERKSFLSAKCPDGRFRITTPKILFKNETDAPGLPAQTVLKGGLIVPCTPQG